MHPQRRAKGRRVRRVFCSCSFHRAALSGPHEGLPSDADRKHGDIFSPCIFTGILLFSLHCGKSDNLHNALRGNGEDGGGPP